MRTLYLLAGLCLTSTLIAAEPQRPNILWLTTEDIGPELGCYGDTYADTPRLDAFAKNSTLYLNAWSNAPVCAPARTTLITGIYPPSTGAEHMRSQVRLPSSISLYPVLMKQAGYYCVNLVKEDYNVNKVGQPWEDANRQNPWPTLAEHQPFLAVINQEMTHESKIRRRPHVLQHDLNKARIPAYHPDAKEVREDWAQYYDNITSMDAWFGKQLDALAAQGLADNTIVFFYGDHGAGMPRSKRSPYNSGLRVPLMIYIPEKFRSLAAADMHPGARSERLVSFVDFAPTLLSLAGVQPPDWMQGGAFMGRYDAPPHQSLFGFRNRMDERYDMIRTVRNERYQYIRNFTPHRPYGQHVATMFEMPTTQKWYELHLAGKLTPEQNRFWESKPAEELYDLEADPDEVHNLVDSPAHQAVLKELQDALKKEIFRIRDVGFLPEAELTTRAPQLSPYELGHDPKLYPLEDIYEMADRATSLQPAAIPQLVSGLSAPDSAVRYWAATGLLAAGPEGCKQGVEALRKAVLADPSPSVRIIAAEALAQSGDDADRKIALDWLLKSADSEKEGLWVALLARNSIDFLDDKAAPIIEPLSQLPTTGPWISNRFANYLPRLHTKTLSDLKH